MDNRAKWEAEAENWVRWARTPGHDEYWQYRESFFKRIVPPPRVLTLELGSGEGRVTRDLIARGHNVVGLDGSMTLLRHAIRIDGSGHYLQADAAALPFDSDSIDCAVAYNSLMDFDDMPGTVCQVARVLKTGSAFCICITHPMLNAGGFDSDLGDAPYVLRGNYFGTQPFDMTVERNGVPMRFQGWSHSLEAYFSALSDAGFVVDRLCEPVPESRSHHHERWHRFPMFLHLRALKY